MPPRVRLVRDELLPCSKSLLNCIISVLKSSKMMMVVPVDRAP